MSKIKYSEIPCIITRKEYQEILNVSKTTILKLIKEKVRAIKKFLNRLRQYMYCIIICCNTYTAF